MKPSSQSFGDEPLLRDPVAQKYVYLKNSDIFPLAGTTENYQIRFSLNCTMKFLNILGEGLRATRKIPKNTVFTLYGGLLYSDDEFVQVKIYDRQLGKENNWHSGHPDLEDLSKNRYLILSKKYQS